MIERWEDPDDIRWYSTPMGTKRSVTSYLKVLNKPALIHWAASTTAEFLRDKFDDLRSGKLNLDEIEVNEIIALAKKHHKDKLEKAGQRGTNIHCAIDEYYKTGKAPKENDEASPIFESFLKWSKEYSVTPLVNESVVYSHVGYAGTLDLICRVDCNDQSKNIRGIYVNDFKTGKAIYSEAGLQVAAYLYAWNELHSIYKISGGMITRLFSDGYEVKIYDRSQCRILFGAFKHIVEYVDIIEKFNAEEK